MANFRRPRGSASADLDDSLVALEAAEDDDSSSSSSSGGDSDGGPAEISLLVASEVVPKESEVVEAAEDEEVIAEVFPAGFHRLPSAMRPPVRRGHIRSASASMTTFGKPASTATATLPPQQQQQQQQPSALKKASQHRRVFSHGQITFSTHTDIAVLGGDGHAHQTPAPPTTMATQKSSGGHRRTGSKTEFILPPGHEEREKKKRSSLQRSGSAAAGMTVSAATERNASADERQRQYSGQFRGGHKRHDSLGFSFRGHSRQASRTDSIYTLRQHAHSGRGSSSGSGSNCRDKLFFFWNRCKTLETVDNSADQNKVKEVRTIVPNHTIPADVPTDKHPNHRFANNDIRTTKYTLLTFLPKNLFEQFHRFANLYFLFIVLLNWVPAINAFGKEISMLPVIFVLGVTAIKDMFEDRRRYLSDKRVNNSTCRVYKSSLGRYVKCLWKDVKVGDLVHLSCNEMIPADILVLRSSDEHGLCYIDTQNLDGETNLKQREVPRGFGEKQSTFQPQDFRSTLECDLPTTKIYRFHGSILHQWGERVPVGKDNLLLRECLLKNTDFVEGLVVYAGHDSKAMLNNGGPRYKRSKLERQMNVEVVWCVVTLIVLCAVGAVGSSIWLSGFTEYVPFLNTLFFSDTNPPFEGFLTFWTFVIILQVIIPLSLYVTIEMTKLAQVYLMQQDELMYDHKMDKRVECRALNIPEELGQVQYIFCDKTGTLTENNMVFKRCTIGGTDYAHSSSMMTSKAASKASSSSPVAANMNGRAVIPVNPTLADRLSSMDIQLLIEGGDTKLKLHPQAHLTQDFFLVLAICNTVIVAKYPHHDRMNASGLICAGNPVSSSLNKSNLPPIINEDSVADSTPSTGPLRPEPSLTPQKRPGSRLLDFFPGSSNPLSPIASSPETSPSTSPVSRPRHLQLPGILSKFVPGGNNRLNVSRSPTPTPLELRPIYEAESPDELALVDAAFAYNCKLLKRSPHHAVVSLPGEGLIDFQVLHVLPFDSVRKRMSIILRHPMSKERILYCKGADSSIFPKLEVTDDADETVVERTQQHLNNYAKQGLRVLVMAKRVLSDQDYNEWLEKHTDAENSLQWREKLLNDSYNRIEARLKLIGATGIEDKLQEGVPETIANLRAAGIVVWVLTGDKQETAVNIAYSCKLFSHNMTVLKINARSRDAAEQTIKCHLENIAKQDHQDHQDNLSTYSSQDSEFGHLHKSNKSESNRKNRALVVDGKTLVYILDQRAKLQKSFLQLTSHCSAVLGCRATPLQKAYIVRIVKEQLGMHTLAIGDGANDVSMIQTADVGVGISGMEGMQAVMASDFAICRFKYLERLLLVHGHWNYDRLSRMVLYFFYKNAAFVFVCFWYQLFCGFSGAVMIDQMYLMLYNLLFTSLPPMAIGIYDQDAPDTVLAAQPSLYTQGRLGLVYKPHSFWLNMADALYQSVVIFFLAAGAYQDSDVGIWEFGTVICTQCLCVMNLQLAIETKSWTIIHWSSLLLSFFLYFLFALLYNGFCVTCFGLQNPYWVIQHSMGTAQFWLVCGISSILAAIPRITARVWQNTACPDPVVKIMTARNRAVKSAKSARVNSANSWSRGTSQSSVLRPGNVERATEMTAIVP